MKLLEDEQPEREKILEFQKIMERLIAQELHMKKEGEDQCRDLDETIRNRQLARKEAAAALEKRSRRIRKKTFVKVIHKENSLRLCRINRDEAVLKIMNYSAGCK